MRSPTLLALGIGVLIALGACAPKAPEAPATAAEAPAAPAGPKTPAAESAAPAPEAAPAALPAPAITQASWAPDALEQLLAPIALYPDSLLGQILAASVNSQEVLDGGNWLLQHEDLKGDALDAAAAQAGFGPAMRALVHFPTVVDMMCREIDWTRQLGSAFTSDQASVLAAVQRLRAQAAQVGNLKSTPQQTVETRVENQKTIIEVKPADPQIVYVPQYNPQVIYTTPPPPPPPPSSSGTVSTESAVLGGLIAFGLGIAIGSAISNNNNCYPHWGTGVVYVGPRPFYPPAYVYRPVYGPALRPAYGYAPPPNYRWGYNNVTINGDVNINRNNNYFNQFRRNEDLRAPANGARDSWKGQPSYAGTRDRPPGQGGGRPGAAAPPISRPPTAGNLPASRPAPGGPAMNRPAPRPGGPATNLPAARPGTGAGVPNRTPGNAAPGNGRPPANTPPQQQRPANLAANRGPPGDRGYGTNRGGATPSPVPAPAPATRDRAFGGASGGDGNFQRSASARGHASAGTMSGNGNANRGSAPRAPAGRPKK